jgi:tRNA-dihydrouridine synthase
MGCPDKDVMKIGAGSSLMVKPTKIGEIIKAMKEATDKPITAKIRLGLDKNHINILRNAKIIEEAGADAIAIHGRTTQQMYSGTADWEKIIEVKEQLNIPVIGNGDITSHSEALQRLKIVDGVMIGRGAMGNPTIFNDGIITETNQIKLYLEYLEISKDFNIHFEQKKRQSMWFMKGFDGALNLRKELSETKTIEEIYKILA